MKKIITTLGLCSTAAVAIYGTVISGRVLDSSGQPLPGASVQLFSYPDSVNKGLTITDTKGYFSLPKIKGGDYLLRVSMVGMDAVNKSFVLSDTTERKNIGTITLTEEAVTLKETIVSAVKAAVVAKQDTMEFNAESFKTHVNSSVEDLLKKLPGVEVASDGTITSGGKTVSKILVDGKEFFSDDPTMASKNLPSDIVDKVQVVDRKSDLARLTGVDDGEEETVINLTVKKAMKNGWFGTIGGGYGTDGRYEGSFNVSTFSNTNQISFVGGANNTNDLGFQDSGRSRFMSFGPSGGITSSQRFGVNFNLGKSEKFRVGGNVFYTHSDRKAISETDNQYLFPDSTSNQREGSVSRDRGHNLRADFRMQWQIDDNNTLDFRPSFSVNYRESELVDTTNLYAGDLNHTRVNSNTTQRFNHGTSYTASGDLIYNHKFASHPGRSFSAQVKYDFSDTHQRTTSWSDIEYYLKSDESEDLYRYIQNKQWNNSITGRLTWTEPLGDASRGNYLQIAYRMQYRFNNADKYTYDIPTEGDLSNFVPTDYNTTPADGVVNETLSNRFRNKFMTQEVRIGYKKVAKLYNLEAGMVFAPSSSSSTDLMNSARNVPTHWVYNVAPFMRFRYKFSKTKSLRVNYRANTSSPSLTQLQPVEDVSDPLNITVGNPDLKPTFTQTVDMRYNNYNQESQQSIMMMVRGQYATNVVVSKTTTDSQTGGRTTTYENANGNASATGMFMINQPFRNRKWRFSGRAMANYSSSAGYINGEFNRSGNLSLAPNVGMTFSCDVFQMSVNPTYQFTMATNSLPQQQNRYTHTYGFTTDATLYLPLGLEFSTDLSYDKSTGYSSGFNTSSWLWNAQLSYSLLSDKSLTLSVRGYDLLAQKKNISRTVSANMITDNKYNDLTRYVMFGVTWKFNTMKNKKREMREMPDDFDGPPGGGERPQGPPPGGMGGGPGGGGPGGPGF